MESHAHIWPLVDLSCAQASSLHPKKYATVKKLTQHAARKTCSEIHAHAQHLRLQCKLLEALPEEVPRLILVTQDYVL